jgi:2-oxoglutarate ferredoxin oxidoreductase subunit alpha
MKIGLLRPITLYPFPTEEIKRLSQQVKGILSVEMSAGQMIEDIKLATECKIKVEHFGRLGGIIPSPEEILEALNQKIIGG